MVYEGRNCPYSEQAVTWIVDHGCPAVQKGVDYWNGHLVYDTLARQPPAKIKRHSIAYTKLAKRNSHH